MRKRFMRNMRGVLESTPAWMYYDRWRSKNRCQACQCEQCKACGK